MKFDIKAREIMREDFPILDSSLDLEKCIKILKNKYEACMVLKNGFLCNILSYDDLLRESLRRRKKIKLEEIHSNQNFVIVKPETDLFTILEIMKRKMIDFILVKDRKEMGLITKNELIEVNQLLFDDIEREELRERLEILSY